MNVNGVEIKCGYTGLLDVFFDALKQAQNGEGVHGGEGRISRPSRSAR